MPFTFLYNNLTVATSFSQHSISSENVSWWGCNQEGYGFGGAAGSDLGVLKKKQKEDGCMGEKEQMRRRKTE